MKPTNLPKSELAQTPTAIRRIQILRISAILVLAGLLAGSLYWSSAASASKDASSKQKASVARDEITAPLAVARLSGSPSLRVGNHAGLVTLPQGPPPGPSPFTITTYAADCLTPKSVFNLQDTDKTVCATVTGSQPGWVIIWSNAKSVAVQDVPIGGENKFFLSSTSGLGDWRAIAYEPFGGSVYAVSTFTVVDAANPSADLGVSKNAVSGSATTGGQAVFALQVNNYGPSDAAAVQLTDDIPAGTTFASFTQTTGPNFSCTNPMAGSGTVCTIASLARGASAVFLATYNVTAPSGTVIFNTGGVSSSTPDPNNLNNSSTAELNVQGVTAETCTLDCPANVVVTANTTSGGQSGAFVTYGAASASGNCGSITNNPQSGSFFTVGLHTVTSSSSTGTSCTFTVNVLDTAAPTISCPPDITVTAPAGATEATVNPGTPTTTPASLTVTGVRSDGALLTDPYPVGITGITWTATDTSGRTASCTQKITVNNSCGTDTDNPTIDAPANITVSTGPNNTACGVALNDELGQADAQDNCAVTVTVSGIPAGNVFPIGTTHLIYTATDPSGNTATDTQDVTVIDDTPPSIAAPVDATYVCPSEVPAGSASQATRGEVVDEDGNVLPPGPPFDNCGTPAVTLTETNNGGAGSAASPLIITRTFTATDSSGNTASAAQTITVADGIPPTISAPADASYQCASQVPAANPSQAAASDNCAAPTVTVAESSIGAGSTASPLVITRTYTATDAAGNSANASQTITVIDNTAPTISLNGANPQFVECHTSYPELGATASDNCSGSFAATASGSVNVDVPGDYTITYNATDAALNAATPVTRTVRVRDTIKPVITRNGPASVTVECHTSFTDAGATASDSCDTNVPVTTSGSVNVNTVGTYMLTYTAADDSGNAADPVTRTVTVVDTTVPTITLNGFAPSMWPPNHKYKTFQVTDFVTGVSDSCDTPLGVSSVVISQVTSDETENGNGDGNTANDIVIAANCKSVQLRSERNGGGNGRVYTITFRVRDASGNTTTATGKVVVPHNNGDTAVDSGPQYTVTGGCP